MKGFATIDLVVLVSYLAIIVVIGSSFYRKRTTSKDYFLGGRAMGWLPVGISIIAADLSAITVMGLPAWGYQHNLELWWVNLGVPLCAPLVILLFIPFYSRLNLYTAYEYLERRFDLKIRLLTSALFQLLRGIHVTIVIYAPALVISLATGMPVWKCVLLMGLVTTLYTALGGMKAVIWTDVIQFCTVMLGLVLISRFALAHVDGGIVTAYKTALAAGRLKLFNLSTDPSQLTSFWACLLGGTVLSLAPLVTDQAILQRLFTTKSEADCKRSIIAQVILVLPTTLILYLTGTVLFVFYHLNPSRLEGLTSSDAIMPFFAIRELPSGSSGLVVAAIFAASMAVMSAGINSITTASVIDFYQRIFRPQASPEHYATVGRVGTVCWGLLLTGLALFAGHLGDLALGYNHVSSILSGPMLGIFLLGVLTARATPTGVLVGVFGGMLTVIFFSVKTDWSFFLLGPVGVAATMLAGYAASLLMRAPSEEQVRGLTVGSLAKSTDTDRDTQIRMTTRGQESTNAVRSSACD